MTRLLTATCASLFLALAVLYGTLLASGDLAPKRTDFLPYYAASTLVAQGHAAAIYALPRLGSTEAELVRPLTVRDGVMPFLYPPHVALAMSPLASLPIDIAYIAWLLVNLALLGLAGELTRRYLRLDRRRSLLLWLALATFLPVEVALAQGQVSLLLLASAASALWALSRRRDVLAGSLLSLLAIKPTYLFPLLLVLAVRGRWKALASSTGLVAVQAAAAALAFGPAILISYVGLLKQATHWSNQVGGFSPQWNQSLDGLASRLDFGAALELSTVAALLVVLARASFRAREIDLPYAGGVVVALVVSPHVLVHDLSLLVVPAAVLWRSQALPQSLRAGVLTAGFVAIFAGPVLAAGGQVSPVPFVLLALSLCLLMPRDGLSAVPNCQRIDMLQRGSSPITSA